MKKTTAAAEQHLEAEDQLTYHNALRMDVDAFLWIHAELDRVCTALFVNADDPDPNTIKNLAADLYCVVDESKAFADQTQEDLETLEKEAGNYEQDLINSGDG